MKKTLYIIGAALLIVALASCQKEVGSKPGNDGKPLVTAYQYAPPAGYNSDEDVQLRFVKNDKVKEAYFLEELSSAKKAAIEADGEDAYIAKVIEQGTKIEFEDGVRDTILTGLANYYDITVVAVSGSKKVESSIVFKGLAWKAGVAGKYYFSNAKLLNSDILPASNDTEFQQCEFDEALYRFKDVYGPGKSLKVRMTGEDPVTDGRGTFVYFRVADGTPTGLQYGSNGDVYVEDIGYALSDDYFYSLGDAYDCGLFTDGKCILNLKYYVDAGSLGYAWDETFIPNA